MLVFILTIFPIQTSYNPSIEEKATKLFLEPLCDKVIPSDFDCIDSKLKELMQIMLLEQIKNDELVYQKDINVMNFSLMKVNVLKNI